ncbi:MAG: hypothetical protein J0H15_00355 [Xanthomonadales bacterium]|nr:hypothetical protein [Xanthomonadales bacterium]
MPTTYRIEPERSVVALDLSPARSGIFTPGIESIVIADAQVERFNALARLLDPAMPVLGADQLAGVARRVLRTAATGGQSPFIASRMRRAAELRAMLADPAWTLAAEVALRVTTLLAYIDDPDDLFADDVPVLGQLDDALLVDIALKHLRAELEDYAEFCRYRSAETARGGDGGLKRQAWEQARADELRLEQQLRRSRGGAFAGTSAERLFRVC